jgi:rhomboid protease GluP
MNEERRKRHPLEETAEQPETPERPHRRLQIKLAAAVPYVTYGLIAINVIIFILRALSYERDVQWVTAGLMNGNAVFVDGEYWRLLTSMFLHASIFNSAEGFALERATHIVFNMATLYFAGSTVERFYGHRRFLAIYLLSGVAGSLLSGAFSNSSSVGASGAVFGVLAAEYVFYRQHRAVLGEYARQGMQNLVSLAIFNAAFGLLSQFGGAFGMGGLRIDNLAHLGGALGGFALATLAGARYAIRPTQAIVEDAEQLPPLAVEEVTQEAVSLRSLAGAALVVLLFVLVLSLAFRL